MKLFLAVVASLMLVSFAQAQEVCYKENCDEYQKPCSSQLSTEIKSDDISYLAKLNFQKSFKYLLLAMNYNNYQRDRPGFSKLFRQQSDKLFDNSIKLIKHLTTRGYGVDFDYSGDNVDHKTLSTQRLVGTFAEMDAIAKALDVEKKLAAVSLNIADTASAGRNIDAEIKHFIQDEILVDQVKTVRKLTGYFNDLQRFTNSGDSFPLAIYLFDEYLQKQ